MKDQDGPEKPETEHAKIKENVKEIIKHMTKIKDQLKMDGIEYEFHINITGTRVLGGVSYGGMNIKDGHPEVVDLNFDGDQPVMGRATPEAPKINNAQFVEEILKNLQK